MTDLETLRTAFRRCRGTKKHVHYPEYLWDQAVAIAEKHPKDMVAQALNVSFSSLKRHIKLRMETSSEDSPFISIGTVPSLRAHISLHSQIISSIDLLASPEELAQFVKALHKESNR